MHEAHRRKGTTLLVWSGADLSITTGSISLRIGDPAPFPYGSAVLLDIDI